MDFFISEHLHRALCAPVRGKPERMCNCGMSSEHLVGTSIPRFTFDTPTKPGNDFYALCEGEQPLVMIFLPAFDHPVTREYLTHYLKTYARLRGVEQARGLRSWSFAAQRIYKTAKEQGYRYDSSAPQILPLTLVVGHLGKILFIHSGRSQTDLPEDCTAIREIAREVASTLAAGPEGPRTRCSDETLTLPDLVGWDDGDNDR